ncbi:MAG: PIN domain-containing protein [Promicromonosporaceae bacterium]|nr:PIN domain-containing protein [Promicromonosporaceae bacterium]
MIVLDASVVIAYTKPGDAHYEASRAVFRGHSGLLVIHETTAAECLTLPARFGRALTAFHHLTGVVAEGDLGVRVLSNLGTPTAPWPVQVAQARADTGLKLPDAVVLATALAIDGKVATFDARLAEVARERGVLYSEA